LIPEENVKDLVEMPDTIKGKIEIQPVKWIDKVLELALERMPEPLPDEKPAEVVPAAAVAEAGEAATGVLTH
jgi:ATP-dependent Lon protease